MWWLFFILKTAVARQVFLEGDIVWGSESNICAAWRACLHVRRCISDRCEMLFFVFFLPMWLFRRINLQWLEVITQILISNKQVCAQLNVQPNPSFSQAGHLAGKCSLFVTGGAWWWQPGPLPGTLLSDGCLPGPKKKVSVFAWDS